MIALNKAMCLAVAWNVHRNSYPVYAETALVHFQDGGGVVAVTNPACLSPGLCYKSAKEIQSPHPGLKIGSKSQQIPRHARVCPRGHLR